VAGSIQIRGGVETTIPANLVKKRDAAEEYKEARDKFRLRVEVAGLVVVLIYAGLTAWQACSTQRIATLTHDQYQVDQRPWLGVTEIATPPELHEGVDLNSTAYLANTGKTPAFHVVQRAGFRILKADATFDPANEIRLCTPKNEGVIFPNSKRLLGIISLGKITSQRADELNSGAYRLYMFGEITYDDAFNFHHFTRFSVRMELGNTLSFAPYGTYDDAN
jgi:hypothetical protein